MESVPWGGTVPADRALRGILGVDLDSANPEGTARVLRDVLGYQYVAGSDGTFESSDAGRYARIRLHTPEGRRVGRVGAGGTHHVAFRVADDDELTAVQAKVEALGLKTSGYIDRFYFHSVYFREPGGILFELATDGPGFASDESLESLGEHLALPRSSKIVATRSKPTCLKPLLV